MQSSALYVITYTEVTYPSDPFDVSLNPLSPLQIQAKMISQERAKALLPDGEFGGGNITCKDINEVQGIIMYLYFSRFSLTILFYAISVLQFFFTSLSALPCQTVACICLTSYCHK